MEFVKFRFSSYPYRAVYSYTFFDGFISPYIYNGIEVDKNNRTDIRAYRRGNVNEFICAISVDIAGTYNFIYEHRDTTPYHRIGFPMVISVDNYTGNLSEYTKLTKTTISGKYRFKNVFENVSSELEFSTIPIKVSINGQLYNYISFVCGREYYEGEGDVSTVLNRNTVAVYNNSGWINQPPSDYNLLNRDLTTGAIKDEYVNAVWDFGNSGQEVPLSFKNWVLANGEFVYPNDYDIKTNNGVELGSIKEAPIMRKANLSYIGNFKTLVLTGTNDLTYTLEWESETPEGQTFGGLSLSAGNGKILIPANGEDVDINLENSTSLYESYQIYRPLEDPFTIMLYKNSSEPHRVDKTDFLTEIGGYSGIFRDSANIVNPIIRVQANDIPNFNYVKIGILNRYYFVTDYDIVRTGLIDLYLTEDVLMTYKEGIYKLKAFVERNEYENNPLLVDKKRVIEEGVNVEVHSIENALMSETLFQPETDIRFVLNGYKIDSADESPV